MSHESQYPFAVAIKGIGTQNVLATTQGHAIEKALTRYRNQVPDRANYVATRVHYRKAKR